MTRYFARIDGAQQVQTVIVCDDPAWPALRLGGTWVETLKSDPVQAYAGIGAYYSQTVSPPRFIRQWVQPTGSVDAYAKGAWVWHNGRAWRSLQAANVFAPGVASWREMLVEWPAWVQPVGSTDAYQVGEKITFDGKHYKSKINANVWSPVGYPEGWEMQP